MKIKLLIASFAIFGIIKAQGTWAPKANFGGAARSEAIGFSIGTKGYIGTGFDGGWKTDFWEYNSSTDTWTQKASFIGGRSRAVGFSIGTKGYIGTGWNSSQVNQNDFWQWDQATNIWSQVANFSGTARNSAVGFSIGTRGYIGTGLDNSSPTNDFWGYDQATNSWLQYANFPGTGRSGSVGFAIGTKGYIGIGSDNIGYTQDFYEWDQVTNMWTQKANFGGTARSSAVGFSIGTKGYVGTGNDGSSRQDFWQWDQGTNSWAQQVNFGGTARDHAAGFSIGTIGYLGTGNAPSYSQDFFGFDPSVTHGISNVSPNNGNLGQTLTVSISGQGTSFGQGTSTTNVWFDQGSSTLIYPTTTSVINSGQVDANFIFPNSIPTGFYNVNVVNSIDGQMTVPNGFLLNPNPNPPYIDSITPFTAGQGQVLTVTISGQHTNFSQGTTTANVWFSQGTSTLIYPDNMTVISDTKISAGFTIPSNALLGFYDVNSYDDLDGQLTLSGGFHITGCTFSLTSSETNVSCNAANNGTATVNPSGGTAPYTFSWAPSGQTTQTITGLSAGNYSVTVTDSNGCSATDLITITQPIPVVIPISGNSALCVGQCTTLSASGGTTYWWNTGATTSSITACPTITTTFSVIGADANGCTNSDSVIVTVNPIPIATTTGNTTICIGNNAVLTAFGGTTYMWSMGATTSSIAVSPTATTTYSVIATNSTCSDTTSVTVTVDSSSASLTMTKDTVNPLLWYIQPTITGTAPFTYLWDFGDGNTSTLSTPTHNYAIAGHYAICLTVTDANGCSSSTCDSTYKISASGLIQNLIVLNPLTGIEENSVSVNSVFPNPANNSITISLSQFVKGELKITDITGREVYNEKVNADNIKVDVSNLPTGYYTLSILSDTKIMREKIMVAR